MSPATATKEEGWLRGGYLAKFMKAGKSGFDAIVPKDPEDSCVNELLISDDEDERMPQKDDPLSKEEIALFKQWIAEGAKFDGESEEDKLITLYHRQFILSHQKFTNKFLSIGILSRWSKDLLIGL